LLSAAFRIREQSLGRLGPAAQPRSLAEPPLETLISLRLTTQALVGLLALDPSPEPLTHLNTEAASLAFSRSDDDKKEYKRQVKKRVQRSMDG
jgi:hypothetical protein